MMRIRFLKFEYVSPTSLLNWSDLDKLNKFQIYIQQIYTHMRKRKSHLDSKKKIYIFFNKKIH